MLPLTKVVDDLYRLLGMELPVNVPTFVADVATNSINGAMQEIVALVGEFFRFSTPLTVTVTAGTNEQAVTLAESTKVIEVIRPDGVRLRPLNRIQEFDNYLAQFNPQAVTGTPEAYWLERTWNSTPGAILHIVPGAGGTSLVLKATTTYELPILTVATVTAYTVAGSGNDGGASLNATPFPIPYDWVESYLIPLARKQASRSHYWILNDPQELQMYEKDYESAVASLRLLNPKPLEDQEVAVDPQQGHQ